MRYRCLHFFVVLIFVASFVGCGGASSTTSVAPDVGKNQSIEAAKPASNSAEGAPPNSQGAMPSYYGGGYPAGQTSGGPSGGPGGGQQPGK